MTGSRLRDLVCLSACFPKGVAGRSLGLRGEVLPVRTGRAWHRAVHRASGGHGRRHPPGGRERNSKVSQPCTDAFRPFSYFVLRDIVATAVRVGLRLSWLRAVLWLGVRVGVLDPQSQRLVAFDHVLTAIALSKGVRREGLFYVP